MWSGGTDYSAMDSLGGPLLRRNCLRHDSTSSYMPYVLGSFPGSYRAPGNEATCVCDKSKLKSINKCPKVLQQNTAADHKNLFAAQAI